MAEPFIALPFWQALLPFALGILVLQLSPGPDMLLILDRGIAQGPRIAFATIAGIVLVAGLVQLGLLGLGLAAVIEARPEAMPILQSAGAAYLLYLGIRMMTTRLTGPALAATRPAGVRVALCEGALSSLTNPKSFLFLFVFLPQFADPAAGPVWAQLVILGAMHKLASLATLSSVALAAGRIGRWTRRWPRLLPLQRGLCGLLMVGIGIALASQIHGLIRH